jgi:signal transduction histidine kinase
MQLAESARPAVRATREYVTARLNRTRTLQGIIHSVTDEAVGEHIPFDHCCLFLPATDGRSAQVWRAARSSHTQDEHARTLDELPPRLAEVMRENRAVFFGEEDLHPVTAETIGVRVRSALAVPLADAAGCFGALCFTSRLTHAYTEKTAADVEWLAEIVTVAVRAALTCEDQPMDDAVSESSRLKQYFVRTLVRDVRLPLSGIVGVLKTIESRLLAHEPLTAADRQLLSAAIEHGERVCFSVDNHLEVVQDANQTLPLDLQPVVVSELLHDTVETVRAEAALCGVAIDVHIAPDTPDLFIDERLAARLLMHVLDAALAQTHDGGRIWVEANGITGRRIEDDGRALCRIDVAEDGAGLSPEDVPYIFDAFRQSQPTLRNATNSNIGLALARRIALAHGGNISARSSLGTGTIYCITLPAVS